MVDHSLTIRYLDVIDLTERLHDSQGVGHRIRDDRGNEADECEAKQPEEKLILL